MFGRLWPAGKAVLAVPLADNRYNVVLFEARLSSLDPPYRSMNLFNFLSELPVLYFVDRNGTLRYGLASLTYSGCCGLLIFETQLKCNKSTVPKVGKNCDI